MSGVWLVSYAVLWMLVLLLVLCLALALRQIGMLYRRSSSADPISTLLRVGAALPDIELSTLSGVPVRVSTLTDKTRLFIVTSPHCSGCVSALKRVAEGEIGSFSFGDVVIISVGRAGDANSSVELLALPAEVQKFVDIRNAVEREWGIRTTPSTVIADAGAKVVKQTIGLFDPIQRVGSPSTVTVKPVYARQMPEGDGQ